MNENTYHVVHSIDAALSAPNTISFLCPDGGEAMLKIAQDGFYVRGQKIPKDTKEAQAVYDAFVSWLQRMGVEPLIPKPEGKS